MRNQTAEVIRGTGYLQQILKPVKTLIGIEELTCRLTELDWYVGLDLLWPGSPIKIETLREWEQAPLVFEQEGLSLTLRGP